VKSDSIQRPILPVQRSRHHALSIEDSLLVVNMAHSQQRTMLDSVCHLLVSQHFPQTLCSQKRALKSIARLRTRSFTKFYRKWLVVLDPVYG